MQPALPSPTSRPNRAGSCQFTSWTRWLAALPHWARARSPHVARRAARSAVPAPPQTIPTGDNFGGALTIADYVGASGRDLMLAVALGYTVQSRLVDHANFMSSGFDHTSQLAFSLNAAAGRLLGLSEQQIANAIAMAAVSDASFAVVRAKPLSQWKGLASAQSALGAMNTLFLARRGVQGPLQVVEGPLGIDHLLRMKINIDWDKQGYEGVVESTIKKYNSMIHTQSAVR